MANSRSFPTGIAGNAAGTTPAAGNIGEMISAQNSNVATNTSTFTTISTITLTAGVWSVAAGAYNDNVATQTGADFILNVKGATGSVVPTDNILTRRAAAQTDNISFIPRVVVVAPADATKTVVLQARSVAAAGAVFGYVTAIRIA